jgi:hypothetical protein
VTLCLCTQRDTEIRRYEILRQFSLLSQLLPHNGFSFRHPFLFFISCFGVSFPSSLRHRLWAFSFPLSTRLSPFRTSCRSRASLIQWLPPAACARPLETALCAVVCTGACVEGSSTPLVADVFQKADGGSFALVCCPSSSICQRRGAAHPTTGVTLYQRSAVRASRSLRGNRHRGHALPVL